MVNFISKNKTLRVVLACLCILSVSACVQPTVKSLPNTLNTPQCNDEVNTNSTLVYKQMTDCINKSQSQRAVFLYAQAGTLTWYQALNDKSETSRLAHKTLSLEALAKLNSTQRDEFVETLENELDNNLVRQKICAQLIRPHQAISAESDNRFSNNWLTAKKGYLHCI